MRNAIKWIAIGLGGLIVVIGAIFAYVAATFDPNQYKSQIIEAVQQKTGRTLQLKGDIKMSFFPTLGAKLGQASLSEQKSDKTFASVTEAVLAVKLIPLLSKDVIVDAIELKGLRANIVHEKSGAYNFDDLTAGDKTKPEEKTPTPFKVDIDHIAIEDADVSYIDHAADAQYQLSKLNLKTGRVANGVKTPVDFSATVAAPKQKANLETKLKAKLTFDTERKLYRFEDLDFSGKGNYGTLTGMNASAKGTVEARLASNEYLVNGLAVTITGKQAGGDMNVKIDAPKLTLTKDRVEGGKVAIDATLNEAKGKTSAKIAVPGVQGTFNAFKTGPLDADIELHGDGRVTKAHIVGPLTGNLEAKRFELPGLALNAKVTDPKLPKGSFDASISGAARADFAKSNANLAFSGKLDQSNVNGRATINRFSPLALTFDLDADELDVDELTGRKGSRGGDAKQSKSTAGKGKDDKIDLSALKGLDAAGSIKVGRLTAMNLKTAQFRADLKVAKDRLDVAPISAQLYQGTLNGSVTAQAAESPTFAVRQQLAGVSVGPLLRDAAHIDTLDGRGTVSVNVTTHGATMDALKKALNGNAAVNLADGSIKGLDIAGTIRAARNKLQELRGQQVQQSNKSQKTDFTELRATFNVNNGVAHNNDLSMKSPLLRVGGEGDIDIGNDRMNYLLRATLVGSPKGQGGRDDLAGVTVPVKLTGALASPDWSIDFAGMATALAKQKLQEEVTKRLGGILGGATKPSGTGEASKGTGDVKDIVRDRLKGIFGR